MTQLILDDHLSPDLVLLPLRRWTTARFLRDMRPGQVIKDERVPDILRSLRWQTFVTIDDWFWNRRLRHAQHCIVYAALPSEEQEDLPSLVRRLFRLPAFRTRAARMGKVARVSHEAVVWWQLGDADQHMNRWHPRGGRRRSL